MDDLIWEAKQNIKELIPCTKLEKKSPKDMKTTAISNN